MTETAPWRSGLVALTKTALLVGGVPFALWRLWFLTPLPRRLFSIRSLGEASSWSHLVILAVAVVWLAASVNLLREIVGALRRHRPVDEAASWSTRWAVAIAAMVVLVSASSFVHGARTSAPPSATATAGSRPSREPTRPAANPARDRTVTVVAGECLADVATRTSGCADDWPAIARENFGIIQADGNQMLDPTHLRSGWRLTIPDDLPAPQDSPRPAPDGGSASLAELALVGVGIITVCALARRLRQLRRVGAATRRDGERRDEESSSGRADAALLPFAEAPLLDWIDVANRLLWRAVQDGRAAPPEVRLVRAGPEGIEFLLDEPVESVPWPFASHHGGRWWSLETSNDIEELTHVAEDCGRLLPGLVPVGDDELASYLVPVGRRRRLAVAGDDDAVDATMSAIVAALRSAPWADELAVELIGIEPPPLEEQCYQLAASSYEAISHLGADAAPGRLEVTWRREPLVVVAGKARSESDEAALEAAGSVAGVVAAGTRGTEVLVVSDDGAVLQPYGIALSAVSPGAPQLALIEALFSAARRPPEPLPMRPRVGSLRLDELPVRGQVEVRLLRPVPDVFGLPVAPFSRDAPRVVEFLAYLSTHEGSASIEEIADALFPRSPLPARRSRAENVAAAARSSLGVSGTRQLLARQGPRLVLDTAVTCDWVRAERALAAAGGAAPEVAERLTKAALDLVEGSPLSGVVAGYGWCRAESLDERIAAEIVDGAHKLATLALAASDVELARWAIERGHCADADSEILARDLMAACDADGDRSGVRAAYSELEAALERLGGNEPSIETRALFEALDGER